MVQHILMIDDDQDDQMIFKEALKELGLTVNCSIANTCGEAFEMLKNAPLPDIIFLDLNMPIMNGFECLASLKNDNTYKDIPVVIFTTTNDGTSIEQTRELGASVFFHKPIEFQHLQSKLQKLISYISGSNRQTGSSPDFVL